MIERACRERKAAVRRRARQCGRDAARAGAARRRARRGHRPDLGARSGQRLSARRLDARRVAGAARARSRTASRGRPRTRWPCTCARMLEFSAPRRSHLRLRQQHPPDGEGSGRRRRLRFPGLRPGLYPPAVLPRHRSVPLGGAVGRSGGHLPHRRQGQGADAGRPPPAPLARHGAERASASRACRRASAGSDLATAIGSALPSTRWWRAANSRRRS